MKTLKFSKKHTEYDVTNLHVTFGADFLQVKSCIFSTEQR